MSKKGNDREQSQHNQDSYAVVSSSPSLQSSSSRSTVIRATRAAMAMGGSGTSNSNGNGNGNSTTTRSPSSPLFKSSMLSRIRSVFSSNSSSSRNDSGTGTGTGPDQGSRERSATTSLSLSVNGRSFSSGGNNAEQASRPDGPSGRAPSRLSNLRAYANGNASSVDLSLTKSSSPTFRPHSPNPHPPYHHYAASNSAQLGRSNPLFSSTSSSSSSSSPGPSQTVLISPSPSDGFLYTSSNSTSLASPNHHALGGIFMPGKLSPMSSCSASQRSPLSASYSPSSEAPSPSFPSPTQFPTAVPSLAPSSTSPSLSTSSATADLPTQSSSLPQPLLPSHATNTTVTTATVSVPGKTHRKSTKSTATLPGWLFSSFGGGSGGGTGNSSPGGASMKASKTGSSIPDSPRTPISATSPYQTHPPHTDNELTPKQKKRRTRNDDLLSNGKGSGDHSVGAYSCLAIHLQPSGGRS